MPRTPHTTAAGSRPKSAPSDPSSLSDCEINTQALGSTEAKETIVMKSSISATVAKVKTTVKTAIRPRPKEKKRELGEDDEEGHTSHKKARKSAKAKTSAMLPLATRTVGMKVFVGAHVSMAKGVQNAITNSNNIGGNAFALFLKSQRKWTSPRMEESDAVAFRDGCKDARFDPKRHILPHGSYLVNLAQGDQEKAKKGYDCFIDDLKRCERLGIGLYNFHPGSTLGLPRSEALARIAAHLNRAHKETRFVRTVLENMAGHGNIIGGDFEDLRDIISQVTDKDRVGVCLDTCHLFAAGHDIRTQTLYDTVMDNFNRIVGHKYLVALHLNDSKAPLGSKRDLHQNIGLGFLGLEAFRVIMNDKKLEGLPMILETPMQEQKTWADEIKLLESLVGMSADDSDFLVKAAELSTKGRDERKKAEIAAEKKVAKTKKAQKGLKKADKKKSQGDNGTGGEEGHACHV